jgi:flagellar assembly protein FliH
MSNPSDKPGPRSKILSGAETAFQRWELPHLMTAQHIERIQKQAYDEGFARGQADGLEAARQATQQHTQQLAQILATLATPLKELDDRVEQELVTLALSMARLIVRRELRTDPAQVLAAVREAMGALPAAARKVRLHLHPEDAALVREQLRPSEEGHGWHLVEDPSLTRGGCKILTETSQIDASVESRLTAIVAEVLGGERADDRA